MKRGSRVILAVFVFGLTILASSIFSAESSSRIFNGYPHMLPPPSAESSGIRTLAAMPWGNWTHYHDYTEIVNTLVYLNVTYPGVVDAFSIGDSWQNRGIYCVRLTNESITSPKPQVLFVGYHHAREPITAELALYFVVYAATNFGHNSTVTAFLNRTEIYVVVALNVDGFSLFKANDWQRKNAHPIDDDKDGWIDEDPPVDLNGDGFIEQLINVTDPQNPQFISWEGIDHDGDGKIAEDWIGGVDLNRNYGFQWQGGSSNPQDEDYKGPAPFSEPETQAIRDLVSTRNFTYAVSFHSGTEVILYPWGYKYSPAPDEAKFVRIAKDLSSLTGGTPYEQSSHMYITYGVWDDWMYGAKNVFSLTCEIFYNETWQGVEKPGPYPNTVWEGGLKYWFNPFPDGIYSTIQRWLPVFFYTVGISTADVAVNRVEPDKTAVGQGCTLKLDVSVQNKGLLSETFNVTVYANATAVQTKTVNLAGGTSVLITFDWDTAGLGEYQDYRISAYAWPVFGETRTNDNTLAGGVVKIVHVGDINVDGKVDIQDLARVSAAFGSIRINDPNDPKYGQYWHSSPCHTCPHTPNADINDDRKVDIQDVARTSANFGWHRP